MDVDLMDEDQMREYCTCLEKQKDYLIEMVSVRAELYNEPVFLTIVFLTHIFILICKNSNFLLITSGVSDYFLCTKLISNHLYRLYSQLQVCISNSDNEVTAGYFPQCLHYIHKLFITKSDYSILEEYHRSLPLRYYGSVRIY